MISVNYPERMIEKARKIVEKANQLPFGQRKEYCQNLCGLSYQYLTRIGNRYKIPSSRTIMNLGYEIYAKDVGTGELILMEMNLSCDWNPANPQMNPSSTKVSVDE